MICNCLLAICIGAVNVSNSAKIKCDAFIGPSGEIAPCEFIEIKGGDHQGNVGMPLSIEVFSGGDTHHVQKLLLFEGDSVFDSIVGKERNDQSIEVSVLPYTNDILTIETNYFEMVGSVAIVKPLKKALLSVVCIDKEGYRKLEASKIGEMLKPLTPTVWAGMDLREERFSYLKYPDEMNISMYMGLYSSSSGEFGLIAIAKSKEDKVLSAATARGMVRFDNIDDLGHITKRGLTGDKDLDISCVIKGDENSRKTLALEVTYMGFKKYVSADMSQCGWK